MVVAPLAAAKVVVFGGSGYTGVELLRWLAGHPRVEVVAASSDRFEGRLVASEVPGFVDGLVFEKHALVEKKAKEAAVALLATPAETSADLAPRLLEVGIRVIDLSGAFRLADAASFKTWYQKDHPHPELLAEATYGLPELFSVKNEATPRLCANPGCYATAALLATAPLISAGLVAPEAVVVLDGKSGTTGAGRKADEAYSFSELAESVRPYRLGNHQHTPEIERALSRLGRYPVRVSFTPHLVPIRRGLIVSAYLVAREGVAQRTIDEVFDAAYGGRPFVRVLKDRWPEPGPLSHTNFCDVRAQIDPRTNTILAFGALDNLVKGAAGQAIQNLNAMLGFDPALGLLLSRGQKDAN